MPELLLELLTEEIPARMQARAAEDLCRLVGAALAPISSRAPRGFSGPRRIGLVMEVAARAETAAKEERGPRIAAPEAALAGFLKKHGVGREALTQAGDFWVLVKPGSSIEAAALVAQALPDVLWSFPWPKSMRWGVSGFTWVRPLQRILCLLDGAVVPFALARGDDRAHGLASGDLTEGHRVHAPGAFAVAGYADFVAKLREHFVLVDTAERVAVIRDGVAALAAAEGLDVVPDEGLLAEVAGLVEWPVPLLGGIDQAFMDLPAEVMRTSMRVNQRYFALRFADGRPAPRFALVANIAASDGGAALVAGNERVLRARLSDARFFWDQDRKHKLEDFLPKVANSIFNAKLGTQGERISRLVRLARVIAPLVGADVTQAERAATLAKADLASGMVGEFPELQGVMGRYYALGQGEPVPVAEAIADHYRPLGATDGVPSSPAAISVALADKLDQLSGFFAVGEKPTGSGDPYALRRAALGVIRVAREHRLALPLQELLLEAVRYHAECAAPALIAPIGLANFRGRDTAVGFARRNWDIIRDGSFRWLFAYDGYFNHLAENFQWIVLPDDAADQIDKDIELIWDLCVDSYASSDLGEYEVKVLERLSFVQMRARQEIGFDEDTMDGVPFRYLSAVDWLRNHSGIAVAMHVVDFILDRLRIQLRTENFPPDIVTAAIGADDDILRIIARAEALRALIQSEDGKSLLAAYKRAQNILRIEDKKDGPHTGPIDAALLTLPAEIALESALTTIEPQVIEKLAAEDFSGATHALATLRPPLDAFFTDVMVNDPDESLRKNRLRLLSRLKSAMETVADLSKIEA